MWEKLLKWLGSWLLREAVEEVTEQIGKAEGSRPKTK